MAIQNLNQLDFIQKKISILEMIEKIKNCGLVWRQQQNNTWITQHNDGNDVWEIILTKVNDSESNGDEQIKYDVIFLDFKKNNTHFYSTDSNKEFYLNEMWDEVTDDYYFYKEEKLLRDLNEAPKFVELRVIKHTPTGGAIIRDPVQVRIYDFTPESFGIRIKSTKAIVEQRLPDYSFRAPRRLAVYGDKIYVTSDFNPFCTLDSNQNYVVSGFGWINVIDGAVKNQDVVFTTNRVIPLPVPCAHIAVSNDRQIRTSAGSNAIGPSRNLRSKIYTSALYGESVIVTNIDKQNLEKFIFTGYQTTSIFLNQNLNSLYVAQTRMDINNQVWRFDLPYGPPYPPTGEPIGTPVNPPAIANGPPFNLGEVPVGVQNTPGRSLITIINTVSDEILVSIEMGDASFNDMTVDYDTNFLFISDAGDDRVLVLDPQQDYKLIKEMKTGLLPVGMEVFQSNLYVVNNESSTISVFDIGQGDFSLVDTIALPNRPLRIKINPRTSLGYVTIFGEYNAYDSRVAIVDLKRRTVIGYHAVGFGPYDLDLDPSSEIMYVSCYLSNFVSTINLNNSPIIPKN